MLNIRENITSILALIWTIGSFIVILTILTRDIKTDDKTTYLILGSQYGVVMLMVGYYWGSNKTLSDKIKNDNSK